MHRALPTTMIDLIRDGVPRVELRSGGSRAVYNALVRTATSARQRGWSLPDWTALLDEPQSHLGRQAMTKDRHRSRSRIATMKLYTSAWEAAGKWIANQDSPWTADDARAEVDRKVKALRDFVADPDAALTPLERAVLAVAADEAERLHHDRPAITWRKFAALVDPIEHELPDEDVTCNLSPANSNRERPEVIARRLRSTLDQLDQRDLLRVEDRGRASTTPGRRRAALRRLPTPETLAAHNQYRLRRSVDQSDWSMDHTPATDLDQRQVYGPRPRPEQGGTPMITVTISATDSDALREALAVVAANGAVQVQPAPAHLDGEVIDLAQHRKASS